MTKIEPILLKEASAARMLDMTVAEFRHLVDMGVLPKPGKCGPLLRWNAEEVRAIATGETAKPPSSFEA